MMLPYFRSLLLFATIHPLVSLEQLWSQPRTDLSLFQNTRYLGIALILEDANTESKPKEALIEVIPIQKDSKLKLYFTRMEDQTSGKRFYPTTHLLQEPVEATITNEDGSFVGENSPNRQDLIPKVAIRGKFDAENGDLSNLEIKLNDHKGTFVMKANSLRAVGPTGYEGVGVIQTDYEGSSGEISSSAAWFIPLLLEATTHHDQLNFIIKTDTSFSNSTFSVYNKKISAKIDQDNFEGKSEDSSLSISGKLSPDRSKIEDVRIQMISGHETYRISADSLVGLKDNSISRTEKIVGSLRLEPETCGPVQPIPKRAP
jgi:hypothetical protein